MYDGIHNDFNAIKNHCKQNGNIKFDENAVFDLLETLFPLYGSTQAIQQVIEMLDAQITRDKDISNDGKLYIYTSDKSNDTIDSIIEVAIPKKDHPFIDLTNNSPESDDFQIIEKIVNPKEESNADFDIKDSSSCDSDNEINSFESSNQTENDSRSESFLNYSLLIGTRKLNDDLNNEQNISNMDSTSEAHEMLEENNNDPNNNLDENFLNEEAGDTSDNVPRVDTSHNSNELNLNLDLLSKCASNSTGQSSKVTGENMQIENQTELVNGYKTTSPVPGCSKDFNIVNNFKSSPIDDDTVKEDIDCIKEIIPWADSDLISSILNTHKNSPNRKQLTLWDLMEKKTPENDDSIPNKKRKPEETINASCKKMLKVEPDYDQSSVDSNALLHLNNVNNSSDCSEFSELQDFEDDQFFLNKFPKVQGATKNINNSTGSLSKTGKINSQIEFNEFVNSKTKDKSIEKNHSKNSSILTTQLIPNPYTIFPIKKERNETVVSGSTSKTWMVESIDPIRPIIRLVDNKKSPKKVDEISSNIIDKQSDDTISKNLEAQGIVEKVKKDMEEAINFHRAQNFTLTNDYDNSKHQERKNYVSNMIQPAKLVVTNSSEYNSMKKIQPTASCIRPANFNYVNSNPELKTEPASKKDLASSAPTNNLPITLNKNTNLQKKSEPELVLKTNIFHRNGNFTNNIFNLHARPQYQKVVTNRDRSHSILKEPILKAGTKNLKSDKEAIEEIKRDLENSSAHLIQKPTPYGSEYASITSGHVKKSYADPQSSSSSSLGSSANSEEVPDKQVYNKLRSIFPQVKSSYVKQICINPSVIGPYNNKDELLHGLINHLLSEGLNHSRPVEIKYEEPQCVVSVDEQYEYLAGIFPDADPTFLRDFVEKNKNSKEVIDQFIQEKLEKRDYPTKEQYLAKIKITEQLKQYTTDFKIEKFLELFPDPFKHFEDPTRKCLYQPIAMEFLKYFFNRIKVNTISREYRKNQYNLSLTAKALTAHGQDMKSKRTSTEMPSEDVPLVQEITFIKNKENIKNHIETLKTKEEQSFKLLKETNMLITCQCCFNDECMPCKSAECNEGHVFCFECIIRGSESTLADGEAHIKCFTNCSSEFSLATLQKILPPTQFSVLLKKRQAAEVMAADVEGLVSCPFCHFASIPPPEDKIFKCLNPECMKETCRQCKEMNHVPLKCDEVIKTDKARLLIEEKMTEALIRTCYKCKRAFFKEEGCNKMTCTCGALMCYVCDKPIKDYKHFNAQGGMNSNLCPLYCDDRLVNAQAVIKVAEECKKALLKNNPNLKIDTEGLLPKLPTKTRGPHDDIPNANELPEHVRRIAGTPQFQL